MDYHLLKESCFFIITIAGVSVATKKERNNNDCEIISGNTFAGSIIPTKKLFEKSGDGNKINPPTLVTTDIYFLKLLENKNKFIN